MPSGVGLSFHFSTLGRHSVRSMQETGRPAPGRGRFFWGMPPRFVLQYGVGDPTARKTKSFFPGMGDENPHCAETGIGPRDLPHGPVHASGRHAHRHGRPPRVPLLLQPEAQRRHPLGAGARRELPADPALGRYAPDARPGPGRDEPPAPGHRPDQAGDAELADPPPPAGDGGSGPLHVPVGRLRERPHALRRASRGRQVQHPRGALRPQGR
ncbi:MAG: hypothetical protein A4E67_01193 [Syntrophaceae bacterium PtaB.Bin038]|nr:MAG: hypothetical protein A4E67_01193 [Syntrophaceae bacterium PtaB.Bin038]